MTAKGVPVHADALVVGFGPVGKLVALRLAAAGHTVVILDKKSGNYPLPRAVTHDSEAARIFQSVGLPPSSLNDVTEPYDGMYLWSNAHKETLLEVDWSGIGESGWYNTYFFHQPALEERFQSKLEALANVTILWESEYIAHEQTENSVSAIFNTTNGSQHVSARYLIGTDGAGSRVRSNAGLDWHDRGYFFEWLVVDVKPKESVHYPHVAQQRCDFARPCTMVPGGPGRRRWEFMKLHGEAAEDINRPEFAWRLLADHGIVPSTATLERHATYTFQAGWATQWRDKRVLIAGDAAHLMPPFAGQGLGAGFRDAMNATWKLSAVLRGAAAESILDTYGSERLPHVMEFVSFSIDLGEIICITDPSEAAERDRRMVAEWASRGSAPTPPRPRLGPGLHRGAHGGTLSIQGEVVRDGHIRSFLDDVLGGAGALIVRNADLLLQLTASDHAFLSELDIRACVMESSTSLEKELPHVFYVTDVDERYTDWLMDLAVEAVLVRPDFYVYGTANCGSELVKLVHSLRVAVTLKDRCLIAAPTPAGQTQVTHA